MLKFLIDENLSPGLCSVGSMFGAVVMHVDKVALAGKSDRTVVAAEMNRDAIVATRNALEPATGGAANRSSRSTCAISTPLMPLIFAS